MDHRPCPTGAQVQAPKWLRSPPQVSAKGPEVPGWALLPATVRPCRDRVFLHERMTGPLRRESSECRWCGSARWSRATTSPQSARPGPPRPETLEARGKELWVETPEGEEAVERGSHRGGSGVLEDTPVGRWLSAGVVRAFLVSFSFVASFFPLFWRGG